MYLCNKFDKELKKEQSSKLSGSGVNECYVSNWPYYDHLRFLKDEKTPEVSSGNLEILFKEECNRKEKKKKMKKSSSSKDKETVKKSSTPSETDLSSISTTRFCDNLLSDAVQIHSQLVLSYKKEVCKKTQEYKTLSKAIIESEKAAELDKNKNFNTTESGNILSINFVIYT